MSWLHDFLAIRLDYMFNQSPLLLSSIIPPRPKTNELLITFSNVFAYVCRGVHEISPMKAANGGVLHVLLDHSHPRLLGGKPSQKSIPSSRPAAKQSPPDLRRRLSVPKQSSENGPAESDGAPHVTTGVRRPLSVTTSAGTNPPELGVAPREFPGSAESYQVESGNTPNNSLGNNSLGGEDGVGLVGSRGSRPGEGLVGSLGGGNGGPLPGVGGRRLGRRLPRCLVVHGMADATVPFVQTATVGAALKALGVPTIVRFEPGGTDVLFFPLPFCFIWLFFPPHPTILCILGLALVGNNAVKHANHCVSWTNRALFFFFAVSAMVIELSHIVRGGEP